MTHALQQDLDGDTLADTVAFTGHRRIGGSWDEDRDIVHWVKQKLFDAVVELHESVGITTFISGMATGTDMWGAEAVVELQDEEDVDLVAAVPFKDQDARWPDEQQRRYRRLLKKADRRVLVNDGDFAYWKYFERNAWMVDHADLVVAVYDGREEGGTYACLQDAVSKGVPIWCIDPVKEECEWL